ncbi:MAG TPA: PASTA domain-containing protein [Solirubrobacteraceae bacterium]|nr:PASTA domain-containing protein [Solirubrobacteraceae bacterium]
MGVSANLRRGLPLLAVTALGALGAFASSAQASSIFFIRSNNIWVANPNGSGAKQVTTDGDSTLPYVWVSAAKGPSSKLAYLRNNSTSSTPRQEFGTMNPDGSGSALNPSNASIQPAGTYNGPMVSINNTGDRIAWPKSYLYCFMATCNSYYAAYSIGVDGSNEQHVQNSSAAINVTFGDPTGQTLLFEDLVDWNSLPASCTSTTHRYALIRQAPAPDGGTAGTPSYYCVPNLDLVDPALRPDGQAIAAVENDNAAAGTDRIVTIPIGGVATASSASPVTTVSSPGTASNPDYSPDGSQLAFAAAGTTIDTVPASGGTPTQILTDATSPAWSPYTLPGSSSGSGGGSGSGASKRCTVPKLKGDTVKQARSALQKHGCKLGSERKAFSRKVKRGHVISQSPAAGAKKAAGSAVKITVSKGRKK